MVTSETLRGFEYVIEILARETDPQNIKDFLTEILTAAEVAEVDKRWKIVQLLHQGVPQRQIAKDLHASLCKITRGSRELKTPDSIFKKILDQKKDL